MKQKFKTAFSLIELSVVILIIGILVAGVTQSSRLITQMRLATARQITQNSPVSSINGLISWWETTSEKSFDEIEASDNSVISKWYDSSPTNLNRNDLVQTNSTKRPIYITTAINGLPALKFNGSNTFMQTPAYSPDLNSLNFSFFAVIQAFNGMPPIGAILCTRGSSRGWVLYYTPTSPSVSLLIGNGSAWVAATTNTAVTNLNKTDLISINYDTVNAKIYQNTNNIANFSASMAINSTTVSSIGSNSGCDSADQYFFSGYISELIFFNRSLKNDERIDVEKYLAKKWGLKV